VAALSAQSVATIHLENVVRRVMAVAVQHQRLPIFHGLAKTIAADSLADYLLS
jgi:hypothetical protein